VPEFNIAKLSGNRKGIQVLKLTGPFTLMAVFDFQAVVREDLAAGVVIDLTEVPYMDSAAPGSILNLHVGCQKDGRRYALSGASDRLRTLFKVAGVENFLVICPSLVEAEARLTGNAASV